MIYVLFVYLLILFFFCCKKTEINLSNPSFYLLFGMIIAVLVAIVFQKEWNLELHTTTFMAISLGCTVFCSVLVGVKKKNFSQSYPFIVISDRKIFLMLLFQLLTFYMTAKIKMEQTGNSVLAEAVNETMMEAKFGESRYSLGFWGIPRAMIAEYGYLCCALIPLYIKNKVKGRTIKILVVSLIVNMVGSLLSGGRSELLCNIVCLAFFYFLFNDVKHKLKPLIIMGITALLFISSFALLGNVIGRPEKSEAPTLKEATYGFAVYCGAEIKNLDVELSRPLKSQEPFGRLTLKPIYNWYGSHFNDKALATYSDGTYFNSEGKYVLGNVFTIFHSEYVDAGLFGILLFTLLMSIVCRLFYVMTIKSNFPFLGIPNFATIGCASMIPQVFLSFFGVSFWGWFGYWLSYKSLFIITLLFFFYGKNIIKYHKII